MTNHIRQQFKRFSIENIFLCAKKGQALCKYTYPVFERPLGILHFIRGQSGVNLHTRILLECSP